MSNSSAGDAPPAYPASPRVGIMGGSFDPPHLAHLLLAETVREALALDSVVFLPTGRQPLKPDHAAAPARHRVEMVRLAIAGNPSFVLSTVEAERAGVSYTVDTLRELRALWEPSHPAVWFIIGADSLASLPRWRDPLGVLALARLAVVRRPGVEVDMGSLRTALPGIDSSVDWVDAPLLDISSTDIRRRVAGGLSIRYRVPGAVREYIETHGLYRLR